MVVDSIQYRSEQSYFMVKPQVISNSIAFRPNELARRDDRLYTYNKLANLEPIGLQKSYLKKQRRQFKIDYDIQLTPYVNKWTMDNGLDIFNSTIAGSGTEVQRLLGLGVSTHYQIATCSEERKNIASLQQWALR